MHFSQEVLSTKLLPQQPLVSRIPPHNMPANSLSPLLPSLSLPLSPSPSLSPSLLPSLSPSLLPFLSLPLSRECTFYSGERGSLEGKTSTTTTTQQRSTPVQTWLVSQWVPYAVYDTSVCGYMGMLVNNYLRESTLHTLTRV